MSKPNSGHFSGTTGSKNTSKKLSQIIDRNAIILPKLLDLREHPAKYKQMSSKKLKALRKKEANRTLTKEEYKHKEWQRRLSNRRKEAITQFWKNERSLIKRNLPTTRSWNAEQRQEIVSGRQPMFKGKAITSHHVYSVAKYPHLANRRELIYPATFYEHIYGWHGGNTKNSLPGIPIKMIKEF